MVYQPATTPTLQLPFDWLEPCGNPAQPLEWTLRPIAQVSNFASPSVLTAPKTKQGLLRAWPWPCSSFSTLQSFTQKASKSICTAPAVPFPYSQTAGVCAPGPTPASHMSSQAEALSPPASLHHCTNSAFNCRLNQRLPLLYGHQGHSTADCEDLQPSCAGVRAIVFQTQHELQLGHLLLQADLVLLQRAKGARHVHGVGFQHMHPSIPVLHTLLGLTFMYTGHQMCTLHAHRSDAHCPSILPTRRHTCCIWLLHHYTSVHAKALVSPATRRDAC